MHAHGKYNPWHWRSPKNCKLAKTTEFVVGNFRLRSVLRFRYQRLPKLLKNCFGSLRYLVPPASWQTCDICGRWLKSFGLIHPGDKWLSRWHSTTPSRINWAKSNTWASFLASLWSLDKTLQRTSQSTHSFQSSSILTDNHDRCILPERFRQSRLRAKTRQLFPGALGYSNREE